MNMKTIVLLATLVLPALAFPWGAGPPGGGFPGGGAAAGGGGSSTTTGSSSPKGNGTNWGGRIAGAAVYRKGHKVVKATNRKRVGEPYDPSKFDGGDGGAVGILAVGAVGLFPGAIAGEGISFYRENGSTYTGNKGMAAWKKRDAARTAAGRKAWCKENKGKPNPFTGIPENSCT